MWEEMKLIEKVKENIGDVIEKKWWEWREGEEGKKEKKMWVGRKILEMMLIWERKEKKVKEKIGNFIEKFIKERREVGGIGGEVESMERNGYK